MFDKNQFARCPKCNEYPRTYEDFNVDVDGTLWKTITCGCGFKWNEVYKFNHNEDVDTCDWLDENGNLIVNITLDKV
jgi:C4-type Zn-finger protein